MEDKKKRIVDWDLIEPEWRANLKTKQQLAAEYGVSRAAMDKHFSKLGVTRDLGAKIRAQAQAAVAQSVVTPQVTSETRVTERDIIQANAAIQTEIILAHRGDIQRARRLTMTLLAELEHQTDHVALYEQLGDMLADPDERGVDKRKDLFDKALSMGSRVGTMKALADSLKTLVALERQAFGIDERENEASSGIDDVIKRVRERLG